MTLANAASDQHLTGWDTVGVALIVTFWLGMIWLLTRD